jgi:hypothetical protein
VTQEQTVYGMDQREREKQVQGIKVIPYYDRRGNGYASPGEVAVPLSVEEIDTLGKALQQWVPRVDLLADLGKALGVETGQAEKQMLKVLHFRLAHAANLLDPERFPEPVGTLADQPQEPTPEPVNEETVPAEVDPDPLIESPGDESIGEGVIDGPPSPLEVLAEQEESMVGVTGQVEEGSLGDRVLDAISPTAEEIESGALDR